MIDHPMSFDLFAFRLQFRALESLYFPPGKAGNVIRGALGNIFHSFVCVPACADARGCPHRSTCAYARLFEPTAIADGPSGLADWPRPFVIRAAHLDGQHRSRGESFHFDLLVFEMRDPALPYFAFSFSQLMREGLGPGRGRAELVSIHDLDGRGQMRAQVFDGTILHDPQPIHLSLAPEPVPERRVRITFLTPTELKAEGGLVQRPEFSALFSRVRDRIHTLRKLYGQGALAFDFAGAGERAKQVRLVDSSLHRENVERRSGKTGQRHSLGGFVGWAEYEGELAEFLPYLRAASWTGVGRQTTWGKGHFEMKLLGEKNANS
jgi:CRISPR-associated endoribonuclease Cas6